MTKSARMQSYLKAITALEKSLKNPQLEQSKVPRLQERLVEIAEKYQDDESIGNERYRIYELQALIHFYQDDLSEAVELLDSAQAIYGGSYAYATDLRQKIVSENSKIAHFETERASHSKSNVGFGVASIFLFVLPILGLALGIMTVFSKNSSRTAVRLGVIGICLSILVLGFNTLNVYNRINEQAADVQQRVDVEREHNKASVGE